MTEQHLTAPFEISDRLTEEWADISPVDATIYGVGGRDHLWDDLSPDGIAARQDLLRRYTASLTPHLDHPDPVQAKAARVIIGWADLRLREIEQGNWKRDLNHIYSPFQKAGDAFDLMPRQGQSAWEGMIARLEGLADFFAGYRASLTVGLEEGITAAQRQASSVVDQLRAAAGEGSRFDPLPAEAGESGGDPERVAAAVATARRACSELAHWLESTYLPGATPRDAVGAERYADAVEGFLGLVIDPHETYQWGWAEVHRLLEEMRVTAAQIDPDVSVEEVIRLLDTDPARSAPNHAEFAEFVEEIQATAVRQLDGAHFDVPDPLKKVVVNIAPPGGSLGAWYHGPSEDLTRPGSIWYAPGERERIPYWQEVSTAYHEGFPGHHLQIGYAVLQRDLLSRFQRTRIWYSGAGEGWALYAERLMDELGYFEKPEYRLGLLASQLFRSTRIVVDIGTQLELAIPMDAPLHPGERWDYNRAVDYMERIGLHARDVAESEVKRYLGWYGQAISYRMGEREILAMREEARRRAGPGFDLKEFHRRMLEAGAIRLDHLRDSVL